MPAISFEQTPLLHIGYHKTGSTWLQERLFGRPEFGFHAPWTRGEIRGQLIHVDPYRFDPARARAAFEAGIAEAARQARVAVISDELLSGNPREGLSRGRLTAQRLEETFPGARVLVCIREQRSMLVSWYKHHVRAGSALTASRFVRPKRAGFEGSFPSAYFEYDALIAHYQARFGRDRVLVLPCEWLPRDAGDFARRVLDFVDSPARETPGDEVANPGYGGFTITLRRWGNVAAGRDFHSGHDPAAGRLARRLFHRLDRHQPDPLQRWCDRRIRTTIYTAIGDRYARSNRSTQQLTGLDLADLGYACGPERQGRDA
jgi:hypothetical protein